MGTSTATVRERRSAAARTWRRVAVAAALVVPPVVGGLAYLLGPDDDAPPTFPDLVRARILAVSDGVTVMSAQLEVDGRVRDDLGGSLPVVSDVPWTDATGRDRHDQPPACLRPGTSGQVVQLHLGAWHNLDTPGWVPVVLSVRCPT